MTQYFSNANFRLKAKNKTPFSYVNFLKKFLQKEEIPFIPTFSTRSSIFYLSKEKQHYKLLLYKKKINTD